MGQGGLTKTGNRRVRWLLVQAAWGYRRSRTTSGSELLARTVRVAARRWKQSAIGARAPVHPPADLAPGGGSRRLKRTGTQGWTRRAGSARTEREDGLRLPRVRYPARGRRHPQPFDIPPGHVLVVTGFRRAAQGIPTQRQALSIGLKTQAWLAEAHGRLHCGVSALPHEAVPHPHDPVPTAAPQLEPGAHEPVHSPFLNMQPMVIPCTVVVVELPGPDGVVVVVVVEAVGHGVVRARHLRMKVSRSRRGLVPLGAVAFAGSRSMPRFLSLRLVRSTKLRQPEPWRLGTAPSSLGFTWSFWRRVGGLHAGRFGSCWSMQTATRSVHALLPHIPSVSHGSPSMQLTTRPPLTFEPGLSTPSTFNSTRQSDFVPPPGISPADSPEPSAATQIMAPRPIFTLMISYRLPC